MALELDTRQRAMLQEMGVHVWLPETGVAILEPASAPVQAAPTRMPHAPAPASRPLAPAVLAPVPAVAVDGTRAAPSRLPPPAAPKTPAAVPETASLDWAALTDAVRNCQACGMCAGRSNTTLVPTPARCDWMVVGDPPDEDEDRAGAPFAGQDGVLLSNMLRALGLQQANCLPAVSEAVPAARLAYVTNVLKCRPAPGAMPQAAELAQCAPYLQREMALIQPKIILAMGRFANQLLLAGSPALAAQPLGKLRGALHRYQGVPVVVTYPPRQLMRNSADKAKAWADLCFAAAALDI